MAWAKRNPEKLRAAYRRYYAKNKEARLLRQRELNELVRREAIQIYGGECQGCGIDDHRVLCFDHIFDDGAEERKKTKNRTGARFAAWLKREGWPLDYQLLCWNCNYLKLQRLRGNG
jgi:hypothetical protein